jgi:hypothetical protein
MSEMTFSIWKLYAKNKNKGALEIAATKDYFRNFQSTKEPLYLTKNENEAFSVTVENNENFIFFMIEHGSTQPRDVDVFNIRNKQLRENPRNEDEMEFMEQFFVLYDYQKELLFISNLRKRNIFLDLLNNNRNGYHFKIKGIYLNRSDFLAKLKTLTEVKFTTKNDLFTNQSDKAKSIEELIGGTPENDVTIEISFAKENIYRLKSFINRLIKEQDNCEISGLLIRGDDESGFERVINNNEFIKKVKINNILKETTGKFDFHLILNNLTSKIEEVSNDQAK